MKQSNHDKKPALVFLHIPKTGGLTVNYILRRSFGLSHVDLTPASEKSREIRKSDFVLAQKIYGKGEIRSFAGHQIKVTSEFDEIGIDPQFFTFLRRPVERALSLYQYVAFQRKRSIAVPIQFFRQRGNMQTIHLAGEANLCKAIEVIEQTIRFVGLVERFDESLVRLQSEFSEFPLKIRYVRQNAAKNNLLRDELRSDENLLEFLRETNDIDEELCKYVERRFFGSPSAVGINRIQMTAALPSVRVLANRTIRNLVYKPAVRKLMSQLG